ncbi:MAG TPA: integrase core domain-containing protein [Chloroflexia bacterium]|nr:integrase core domain-containing protein [Chloroflexia bacterium]
MPWKEICAMDQRVQFVADCLAGELTMAAVCRAYGISRPTGYKWLDRYRAQGAAGLEERSRAPLSHPHAVAAEVEAAILAARAAHPTWGPRKLLAWLQARRERGLEPPLALPAASTAGEILRRAGLAVPRRRRARTPPWTQPLAHAGAPNAVWCADFKGQFRTADGARCYPLTISDASSRYLLRCVGLAAIDGARVRPLFEAAFREFGLPRALRTDNGPPFASVGLGGLTPLSAWWIKLGIVPERIEPGRPEQNGRHERLHRTLKRETAAPPAATPRAQQAAFDRFRREYNAERPHEALGQRPPASAYSPSPRPFPERLREPEYPDADAVRRVRSSGEIRWGGRLVYLSESLIGEPVGLTALDDRHWLLAFGPLVLGVLDTAGGRVHRPGSVNHVVGPPC